MPTKINAIPFNIKINILYFVYVRFNKDYLYRLIQIKLFLNIISGT